MVDEKALERISSEPGWVEIDSPTEDDDEYTVGYLDDEPIRSSTPVGEVSEDSVVEVTSGPYEITVIDDDGSRMVFVEKQEISDQDREIPKAKLKSYSSHLTATIPEPVIERQNIEAGHRFGTCLGICEEQGTVKFTLDTEGELSTTVSETFNRQKMDHEYEMRIGGLVGELCEVDDGEYYAEWQESGGDISTITIETPIELPEYEFGEDKIRNSEPSKVSFEELEGRSYYTIILEDDVLATDEFDEVKTMECRLGKYQDEMALRLIPQKSAVSSNNTRTVEWMGDDEVELKIPEKVGDILELYNRTWIRFYWEDDEFVGLITETYGDAPLLK